MTPRRILVIDDEHDLRRMTRLTLQAVDGWEVSEAASGEEGLDKAMRERPEAILLDVMMPGMSGLMVYRALQAHDATRGIPVVLLTARVDDAELEPFRALGLTTIIYKPYHPMELGRQIAGAVGW
jgi:CheY-like chemotaxis protein